jgi:hypothetical protein
MSSVGYGVGTPIELRNLDSRVVYENMVGSLPEAADEGRT